LFAPGNNERLLGKVFEAGADAVVLDLEDSVPPGEKQRARRLVAAALKVSIQASQLCYVRINSVASPLWRDDLLELGAGSLHGVRLAKAESGAEIAAVDEALSEIEDEEGVERGRIRLVPTIESAVGVLAAGEIARGTRVEALCFGASDFASDIGAEADESGVSTLYAQSHLVLVSRATGIQPPIASVYTRIRDADGLRASTLRAKRLGFFGRSCIHPSQITVVNEVFTPSAAQVAEAQDIIDRFEEAGRTGSSAILMQDGQFIDAAVVRRARDIVQLSERLALPRKVEANR